MNKLVIFDYIAKRIDFIIYKYLYLRIIHDIV